MQGITTTGGSIRGRSHQPLHWVYPQPQQQHHQRSTSAWNQSVNSLCTPTSNAPSLDSHQTTNSQGNISISMGGHHKAINNSMVDATPNLACISGPPPSVKNGTGGCSGNTTNTSPTNNDDEWKNIHVVSLK